MRFKTALAAACLLSIGQAAPPLYSQNFTFSTLAGGSPGFLDDLNSNAQFNYGRVPQLDGMAVAAGGFQFVVNGQAGSNCVIEVSSDLVAWSPLSTNLVPESGPISVNDPAIATQARRFYRAVLH